MPIYAFECDSCGHQFDRLQKLSDADPTDCPACEAPQIRRQLTAPSFRLAGSGWYETDFKKDSDKKRNLVDTHQASGNASGKSSSSKPASSSEAKPAETKSESKPSSSTPS